MIRGHNKKKLTTEVITRAGHPEDEDRLAQKYPQKVIEALLPLLSESRKDIIDRVVSHRTDLLHIAVEGVNDPHNVAAVLRTCDAFGVLNVHIIETGSKFKSSAAVTQGAHKWLDINVYSTTKEFVDAMHKKGIKIYAAAMEGAVDVATIKTESPVVLVFGNESEGISDEMLQLCDAVFKIPMFGFVESFNVSVAAAITMSVLRGKGAGNLSPEASDILKARYYFRSVRSGSLIVRKQFSDIDL
ncbi:MAG: RNA methyltransferase [Deltaproteobacteria bacterium]|nr:RNA methyltransferase [Deltaproteobacteria bacterium]